MTLTCRRCNNDFGTAEDQLRSLLELEVSAHVESTDGSVRGRRPGKLAFRSTQGRPTGTFVRSGAPEFEDILNSGASKLVIKPVDMDLAVAAALKHAYLAVCLTLRKVPQAPSVERVRAVLLAARNRDCPALRAALVGVGDGPFFGWAEGAGGPSVFLISGEAGGRAQWAYVLGGRFIVPWPFPDVHMGPADELDDEPADEGPGDGLAGVGGAGAG